MLTRPSLARLSKGIGVAMQANYSLKRTAATGCGMIMRHAAAAA